MKPRPQTALKPSLNLYPHGYWFVVDEFGQFRSGPWMSRTLLREYLKRRLPKRHKKMRLVHLYLTPREAREERTKQVSKKEKKKVRRFLFGYRLRDGGCVYGKGEPWVTDHMTLRDACRAAERELQSPECDRYVYELVPVKKLPGKKARP